jgi:hypothetical protein
VTVINISIKEDWDWEKACTEEIIAYTGPCQFVSRPRDCASIRSSGKRLSQSAMINANTRRKYEPGDAAKDSPSFHPLTVTQELNQYETKVILSISIRQRVSRQLSWMR